MEKQQIYETIIQNLPIGFTIVDEKGTTVDFNESAVTWNTQPCGTSFDNSANCNLTAESSLTPDGTEDNS